MAQSGSWFHAVFASPDDARYALKKLGEAGVAAGDIEMRSSIPLEDVHPVGAAPRTRLPWTSLLGGLLGGTGAFLLVSLSSQAYPLPTGGMPIVPAPTTGIIIFEGTAIGATLFTVATVFLEGALFRMGRAPRPLDRYLAAGNVIISVRSGSASQEWAKGALVTEAE
jgi:hypothetical protein